MIALGKVSMFNVFYQNRLCLSYEKRKRYDWSLGDSIVYGSCDSEALEWVGRWRRSFHSDDWDAVYNFGICGETSSDVRKRFAVEIAAIKPTYVVLAIGINDTKFPAGSDQHLVSIEQYEENLEWLLGEAKQYTAKISLVGLTKVVDMWRSAKGSRFLNEEIGRYDAVIQVVADRHTVQYIPMLDVLSTEIDLADGLHPNASGYEKMFKVVKSKLKL
jgi:lysophospholipase L1-like esterase